jgi:DNA-binding MarR family transcriptional regulator
MTHRNDHLEGRGFVRRRPDATDARSVRVQLTAAGRRRVDAALRDLVEREDAILDALDTDERAVLARLLRRVVAPFDAPSELA